MNLQNILKTEKGRVTKASSIATEYRRPRICNQATESKSSQGNRPTLGEDRRVQMPEKLRFDI